MKYCPQITTLVTVLGMAALGYATGEAEMLGPLAALSGTGIICALCFVGNRCFYKEKPLLPVTRSLNIQTAQSPYDIPR